MLPQKKDNINNGHHVKADTINCPLFPFVKQYSRHLSDTRQRPFRHPQAIPRDNKPTIILSKQNVEEEILPPPYLPLSFFLHV